MTDRCHFYDIPIVAVSSMYHKLVFLGYNVKIVPPLGCLTSMPTKYYLRIRHRICQTPNSAVRNISSCRALPWVRLSWKFAADSHHHNPSDYNAVIS